MLVKLCFLCLFGTALKTVKGCTAEYADICWSHVKTQHSSSGYLFVTHYKCFHFSVETNKQRACRTLWMSFSMSKRRTKRACNILQTFGFTSPLLDACADAPLTRPLGRAVFISYKTNPETLNPKPCLIWLNTGKLTRSRHSKDWQIETGVCKINARSKTIRHDSQPPFPQSSMLTKWNLEWIGVQNKRRTS